MPSTYSPNLRLTYQAVGENLNTWGVILNANVFQLIEDAISTRVALVLAGNVTLSVANGVTDQARCAFLDVTGTAGIITTSQTQKLTLVRNATAGNVTLTTGSLAPGRLDATLATGDIAWMVCDGTNWRLVKRTDMQGEVLKNLAPGVASADAVNKGQLDSVDVAWQAALAVETAARIAGDAATLAAANAYADSLSFGAGGLPGGGTPGQYLQRIPGPSSAWVDPATQVEAEAGTNNIQHMTALRTSQAISALANVQHVLHNAGFTFTAADRGKLVELVGTFTAAFPPVATIQGWSAYVWNNGTGDVTLDPDGAELIDGLASYIVYPGEVRLIWVEGAGLRSVPIKGFAKQFTASGNFTEPPGYSKFEIDGIGGGGGGGGSSSVGTVTGAGGGGGGRKVVSLGAYTPGTVRAITIGAGGVGAASIAGTAGGNTTYGALFTFYGGGPGATLANFPCGGGGGGGAGAGASGVPGFAFGGLPNSYALGRSQVTDQDGGVIVQRFAVVDNVGWGGGGSFIGGTPPAVNGIAGCAEWGGGGGGPNDISSVGRQGGSSLYGAGGGGGSGTGSQTAKDGGAHRSYVVGGGGAAGVNGNPPTAGTAGAAGNLLAGTCGNGGGGGGGRTTTGAGGNGGNGGAPGGGGGGAGVCQGSGTAIGGSGGRGELVIYGVV